MLKIYKDDFATKEAIENSIAVAENDHNIWKTSIGIPAPRFNPIIQQIRDGEQWEFVNETREEERARLNQESIDAYEADKLAAQSTPSPKYAQYRLEDYNADGLTMNRWNELGIEENATGQLDFKARREVIRQRFPKPV